MKDMNFQVTIGQEREEVTIPLNLLEELLGYRELALTSVCLPFQEVERFLGIERAYLNLRDTISKPVVIRTLEDDMISYLTYVSKLDSQGCLAEDCICG